LENKTDNNKLNLNNEDNESESSISYNNKEERHEMLKKEIEQIDLMDSEIVKLKRKTEKLIKKNNKLLSLNVESLLSCPIDLSSISSDEKIIDINSSHFDFSFVPLPQKSSNSLLSSKSKKKMYNSSSSVTINVTSDQSLNEEDNKNNDKINVDIINDKNIKTINLIPYEISNNIIDVNYSFKDEEKTIFQNTNTENSVQNDEQENSDKDDQQENSEKSDQQEKSNQNNEQEKLNKNNNIGNNENGENDEKTFKKAVEDNIKINEDIKKDINNGSQEEYNNDNLKPCNNSQINKSKNNNDNSKLNISNRNIEKINETNNNIYNIDKGEKTVRSIINEDIKSNSKESSKSEINTFKIDPNFKEDEIIENNNDQFNNKLFQIIREKEHLEYRFKLEISQFKNQLEIANDAIKNFQDICSTLDEELGDEKRKYANDITSIQEELKNSQMEIDFLKKKLDKEEKENTFLIDEKNSLIDNLTNEKEKINDLKLTLEMIQSERDLLADELSKIIPQFEKLKEVEEKFHKKQMDFENSKLRSEESISNGLSQSLEYMNLLKDFKKQLEIKANLIDEANPTGKIEVITESIKELDENYIFQLREMTDKINNLVDECNKLKKELESKDQTILNKDKDIQDEKEKNKQFQNTIDLLNNKISYFSNMNSTDSETILNTSIGSSGSFHTSKINSNVAAAKYIEYLENAFIEDKKFSNNIVLHYALFDKGKKQTPDDLKKKNTPSASTNIGETTTSSSDISKLQKIINDKDLVIQSLNQRISALLHEKEMLGNSDNNDTNNDNDSVIKTTSMDNSNGQPKIINKNYYKNKNNNNNILSSLGNSTSYIESESKKDEEIQELKEQNRKLKEALNAKTNLIMEFSDIEKNNTEGSFIIYENSSHNTNINDDNYLSKQRVRSRSHSEINLYQTSNSSLKKSPFSSSNNSNKEFTLDKEDFYKVKEIILEVMDEKKEKESQLTDLNQQLEVFASEIKEKKYSIKTIIHYLKDYVKTVFKVLETSKIYNFQFESLNSFASEYVNKSTEDVTPSLIIKKPILLNANTQTTPINQLLIDSYTQTNNINYEWNNLDKKIEENNDKIIKGLISSLNQNSKNKFFKLLNTLCKLLEGENKKSKIIRNACQKKINKNKNTLSLTPKDSEKLINELNKLISIQKKIKEYLRKHMKQIENAMLASERDPGLISDTTNSSESIINSLDLMSITFDENQNMSENNVNENLKLLLKLDDILKSLNINNEIKCKLEERTEGLMKLWKFEMNKYK